MEGNTLKCMVLVLGIIVITIPSVGAAAIYNREIQYVYDYFSFSILQGENCESPFLPKS